MDMIGQLFKATKLKKYWHSLKLLKSYYSEMTDSFCDEKH